MRYIGRAAVPNGYFLGMSECTPFSGRRMTVKMVLRLTFVWFRIGTFQIGTAVLKCIWSTARDTIAVAPLI